MEPVFQAHPIPQNVTNFEFHLVGDMTLKQFGYLAAGLGIAFLVFTTLSSVQPLIAWPIIIISALLGVAFAFLPIQERPLDHWVAAFFRAIFKPTSLKYSSKILSPEDPLFKSRLNHYLKAYQKANEPLTIPPLPPEFYSSGSAASAPGANIPQRQPGQAAPSGKKQNFIDKFKSGQTGFGAPLPTHHAAVQAALSKTPQPAPQTSTLQSVVTATTPPIPAPTAPVPASAPPSSQPILPSSPTPGILRNPEVISKLPDLQSSQNPTPTTTPPPPAITQANSADLKKTVDLAKEAQETQQQIVKIEASLSQIKQQAAQPGVDPKTYVEQFQDLLSELQKLNEKASKTAKELAEVSNVAPKAPEATAAPIKAKSIPTLKLTSFPNIVNGIVTDSQGNYIEGAIVVAHDKQGLPVRALKSNKLGQFVAATPLPNGEYTIVVEKDSLVFDKAGIELKNEVLPPILIAAKKAATA